MRFILRTTLVAIVTLGLLASSLVPFMGQSPRTAHAGVPIVDTAQFTKEFALDTVARAIARAMLFQLVNQTVQWVQGTPTSGPRFVTDWENYFIDAADQATGVFIEELGAAELCTPFGNQLRNMFPRVRFRSGVRKNTQCTLQSFVEDVQAFRNDFRRGSWTGWVAMLQPQNRFGSSFLISDDEKIRRVAAAERTAKEKAQDGFLGQTECIELSEDGETCLQDVILTPGKTAADAVTKSIETDFDFIINSDELNEIIAALVAAAINRVGREGLIALNDSITGNSFDRISPQDTSGVPQAGDSTRASCVETKQIGGDTICSKWEYGEGGDLADDSDCPPDHQIGPRGDCQAGPGGPGPPGDDENGDGGGGGIPTTCGTNCVFFASNGAEYCDEDEDFGGVINNGGDFRFVVNDDNGATYFIIPHDELGVQRCQEYGTFPEDNPPFDPTITFTAADSGNVFSLPPVSSGNYTLGSWGGSGGSNEAFVTGSSGSTGSGSGNDGTPTQSIAANLSNVTFVHDGEVANWSETANLQSVSIGGGDVVLDQQAGDGVHDPSWPIIAGINGVRVRAVAWIFVWRNGRWVASTWEYLRPRQETKSMNNLIAPSSTLGELKDFSAVPGERYGFMVSCVARVGLRSGCKKRSNVVMATWP